MSQGLLHIHVPTRVHGHDAGRSVHMIRRGDEHRINVFLLLDQLPVVAMKNGIRVLLDVRRTTIQIHIAQGNEVDQPGAIEIRHVASGLTTNADAADVELLARRCETWAADHVTRHNLKPKGGSGGDELATIQGGSNGHKKATSWR